MRHQVEPGSKVKLKDFNPDDTGDFKDRDEAESRLKKDVEKLAELQEKLYAENRRSLLIVLQAMDTGGKDGTIKHVLTSCNPSGCVVSSFKAPSDEERDHDYLWRIHRATPNFGNIGIFNRSHYEDVLVVRVHELVKPEVWRKRYDQINRFEELLVENGTVILKFFLHISKAEQKRRLESRLAEPDKLWKFSPSDLAERKHWDAYEDAYEDVLSKCSTERAPWFVIPANKKWYRNYAVARTIVRTLEQMDPRPPRSTLDVSKILVDD